MQTIGERLMYFIESQGGNLTTFSEKSSINYTSLSEITRNKRNIGGIVLKKIADVEPNLNLNWLFLGKGDMLLRKKENSDKHISEPNVNYNKSDPGKEMLLKYLDDEEIKEKIIQLLNTKNKQE